MFAFYVITFAGTGRQAVMRQTVIGAPEVALMQADGTFAVAAQIAEPFTARRLF